MKPESICVSLEKAKELEAAGWPQDDSIFYWHQMMDGSFQIITKEEKRLAKILRRVHVFFAASTCEEIFRRLPQRIKRMEDDNSICRKRRWARYELQMRKTIIDGYYLFYKEDGYKHRGILCEYNFPSLANASASLWIFLKKNNLLPSL